MLKDEKIEKSDSKAHLSDSESSLNLELSDDEYEDGSQPKVLVRFASASSSNSVSSDYASDYLNSLQFDQPSPIEPIGISIDSAEPLSPLFDPSTQTYRLSLSEPSPTICCESLVVPCTPRSLSSKPSRVLRPPKSSRKPEVEMFLAFHRASVTESHYFLYFDYRKLCTQTLLAMAEQSEALRNSVVAFSALIYSIKVDPNARQQALSYYAIALKELRELLNRLPLNSGECHAAIATALQLASFDVHLFHLKTNFSVSLVILLNVFDIYKEQRT
jgi:hypothetical protein